MGAGDLSLRADRSGPDRRRGHAPSSWPRAGPGSRCQLRNAHFLGRFVVDHGRRDLDRRMGRPGPAPAPAAPPTSPRCRRRASRAGAGPAGRPPRRGLAPAPADLAIPDYDTLSASQVVRRLDGLGHKRARGRLPPRGGHPGSADDHPPGPAAPRLRGPPGALSGWSTCAGPAPETSRAAPSCWPSRGRGGQPLARRGAGRGAERAARTAVEEWAEARVLLVAGCSRGRPWVWGRPRGRPAGPGDGRRLGRQSSAATSSPGAREVGVGEALVEELLGWFAAQGCTDVDALALPGDRRTKQLCETPASRRGCSPSTDRWGEAVGGSGAAGEAGFAAPSSLASSGTSRRRGGPPPGPRARPGCPPACTVRRTGRLDDRLEQRHPLDRVELGGHGRPGALGELDGQLGREPGPGSGGRLAVCSARGSRPPSIAAVTAPASPRAAPSPAGRASPCRRPGHLPALVVEGHRPRAATTARSSRSRSSLPWAWADVARSFHVARLTAGSSSSAMARMRSALVEPAPRSSARRRWPGGRRGSRRAAAARPPAAARGRAWPAGRCGASSTAPACAAPRRRTGRATRVPRTAAPVPVTGGAPITGGIRSLGASRSGSRGRDHDHGVHDHGYRDDRRRLAAGPPGPAPPTRPGLATVRR